MNGLRNTGNSPLTEQATGDCVTDPFSSRVCERGTFCCEVTHVPRKIGIGYSEPWWVPVSAWVVGILIVAAVIYFSGARL